MDELFRCPFCNGTARHWLKRHDSGNVVSFIECNRCHAKTGDKKSRQGAIKAWNRRKGAE